jgi:hypothetical protein
LLECGLGPCPDDPVAYKGWIWLRSYIGFWVQPPNCVLTWIHDVIF